MLLLTNVINVVINVVIDAVINVVINVVIDAVIGAPGEEQQSWDGGLEIDVDSSCVDGGGIVVSGPHVASGAAHAAAVALHREARGEAGRAPHVVELY